jgi:uncharacterized delta-60 repeat protein
MVAAAFSATVFFSGLAVAASGGYDLTFGTGGVAGFNDNVFGPQNSAFDVLQLSDGRLLLAGEHGSAFAVLGLETDGSLDASFAAAGKLVVPEFGASARASALAVQADGKVVAVGATDLPAPVLVRFDGTGTLDSSFGTSGRVELAMGGSLGGVTLQADGRIVAVGSLSTGVGLETDLLVVRLMPDGSLDGSFGTGGVVSFDLDAFEFLGGVEVQGDGHLVALGSGGVTTFAGGDVTLLRLDTTGALDPTFGTSGVTRTDLGGTEFGVHLALQSDGKIVGGGFGSGDSYVLRWDTTGALDAGFGVGGVTTLPVAVFAPGIAVQDDGKIVAVATLGVPSTFVVARLDASGVLDPTFGVGGFRANPSDGGGGSRSAILQADGKIVTAAQTDGGGSFSAVRFEGRPCAAAPLAGCNPATEGRLVMKARPDGFKVVWKWGGLPLDVADFGNPAGASAYGLCVYDANGVVLDAIAPAGASWRPKNTGFKYRNRDASRRQLATVALAATGRLKAVAKTLDLETSPPLALPLTTQLARRDSTECWEARYFDVGVRRNVSGRFKGSAGSPSGAFLER